MVFARLRLAARNLRIAVAVLALCAGASCKTDEALFEEVPAAEQLWAEGTEALKGRSILGVYTYVDYEGAIEKFQKIVDNYPNSDFAIRSELAIADAYFQNEKYDEALSYYRDFSDLHPQHEKVPYTLWQAAQCHERRSLAPGRDQAATRDALVFLDRLLLKHAHSSYAQPAEEMWRDLQTRLATNVEGIADFYFDRGEYEAAAERYRALLNEYPGLGFDPRVLWKLGTCYAELQRSDEADRIFRTLVAHYADSEFASRARRQLAINLP
ncbi:MAG: outer membrane protein assembly factor BamD [Deltaproteobacteria bacterium]|nr:MAG: outer membrane protein assembly factor BamD [Deltaproteobacteria bacterium]